jgi:SET domain-containing protein
VAKRSTKKKTMFSLAPVLFRDSTIEGRGVFARRRFEPGDLIVPYAPKQRRLDVEDPEAVAAADTKFTLLSDRYWVIIPDTSVPGGWLCNHSCNPNAAIYSSGEGRIQCIRPIQPGEEVTIFYGWVTRNEPERDPCLCGSSGCRGFINFDFSDDEAEHFQLDTEQGRAFRQRLEEYAEYLRSVDQQQVLDTIAAAIAPTSPSG